MCEIYLVMKTKLTIITHEENLYTNFIRKKKRTPNKVKIKYDK